MPGTFAHYFFGQQILEQLEPKIKEPILKHLPLFNFGLHGPDILFYYKPLQANSVTQKGQELHKKTGSSFLENARKIISSCPNPEAAKAYILGFICHFMLDSELHPYVREVTKTKGISHSEIETEFERLLMLENQVDPLSFRPTNHLVPKAKYATCIAWFYEGVTTKQILKALKSMQFHLNFLVAPRKLKRLIIAQALKLTGNYESMNGLVMSYTTNPNCVESSLSLKELMSKAIGPTKELVTEFYYNLGTLEQLNNRFNSNFG